jgi:hypothetical protein
MSNHLAIATVTATLQRLIQSVIQHDVDGARVTTLKPNSIGSSTPESGINIFLYQVAYNTALRNNDTASFRSKKGPIRRQSSLDLFYMLSAYGNDTELEPQRLLGSVIRALSDKTILTTEMIEGAIADTSYLAESDLASQIQQVTLNPVAMDVDELSKVWSTFFQAPYSLSLVYKVMAVVIDGEVSAQRALPVRETRFGRIMPFPVQPVIERVLAEAGARSPIDETTMLRIVGSHLQANSQTHRTLVKVGDAEVVPIAVTATELAFSLKDISPADLRAGIQTVQVLHYSSEYSSEQNRNADEKKTTIPVTSNAIPFVLRPTITSVSVGELEGIDDDPRSGTLQVSTQLPVGPTQQVMLVLNEYSIDSPVNYLFEALPREADSHSFVIPLHNVKPGDYLVCLRVDRADSLLGVDTNPDSQTFNWFDSPRVIIQ